MPFVDCTQTTDKDTQKKRTLAYSPIFITCGPIPTLYQDDQTRKDAFLLKMHATAKVHFGTMLDRPYFCVLEVSDTGYHHCHQMIVTAKRTTRWLSYTYKVKDLLRLNPDFGPDETRLPNCAAHHCMAPKHVSPAEIMTNYVTFSTKGKNIGSGDIRLDPLGPEPMRPILDRPSLAAVLASTDPFNPTGPHEVLTQWHHYDMALQHWKDRKRFLNIAKAYKREHAHVLSHPTHPHHAYHKAQLARKEKLVADFITRVTSK